MREAFEVWWSKQVGRGSAVESEKEKGWYYYLDDEVEYKQVAWLAWQGAFASMAQKVEV